MNAHDIQVNPYKAYKSLDIKNHNIDIAMKLNRCDNNTFSQNSHIFNFTLAIASDCKYNFGSTAKTRIVKVFVVLKWFEKKY